jgi:CheY-like chemotaxis protein
MTSSTEDTSRSVLVVDDDDDFCASMSELLVNNGYTVRTCKNGREALDVLADETYQPLAIIVDLRMPEMDGFAFLAACEVEPRLRESPIIVVSAYGDPTGIESDFMSKPVNVSRLLRSLGKIVGTSARVVAR